LTKQSDRLALLTFENEQLKARVAALEARLPPEPPPLMMSDLKVYGHQRPTLSLPKVEWMPSRSELKDLARIVYARFPYLIELTTEWLEQFRVTLLALYHFGRTEKPNRNSHGLWVGEWLTNHRHFDAIERGPFLAAIAASGDIVFSGFEENAALQGIMPMAGIARPNCGSPPDRTAWKKVLAEKRLTGETAAAQVTQGRPDRWENPRSRVELLPQYDRR